MISLVAAVWLTLQVGTAAAIFGTSPTFLQILQMHRDRAIHHHDRHHHQVTPRTHYLMATLLSIRGGDIQTISSLSQIEAIIDEASQKNALVVLDFAANNCPPCEMMAPVYAELSDLEEFADVAFCKVNVSDHPEIAERYGVNGWPTFLLFKGDSDAVDSIVGGQAAKAGLYGLVAKYRT